MLRKVGFLAIGRSKKQGLYQISTFEGLQDSKLMLSLIKLAVLQIDL